MLKNTPGIRSILAAVAFLVALLTPMSALASEGSDFGSHVSDCARTHGFTGDHNPGMHQGLANWPGTAC